MFHQPPPTCFARYNALWSDRSDWDLNACHRQRSRKWCEVLDMKLKKLWQFASFTWDPTIWWKMRPLSCRPFNQWWEHNRLGNVDPPYPDQWIEEAKWTARQLNKSRSMFMRYWWIQCTFWNVDPGESSFSNLFNLQIYVSYCGHFTRIESWQRKHPQTSYVSL